MQVVLEKEKGCHFSNHYFVQTLSLWPTSSIVAQTDRIHSASPGFLSQIPNHIWGAILVGGRRQDYRRTSVTSPGEASRSRGRDTWQWPGALELLGRKFKSIRKSHFPATFLPTAQASAAAHVYGWKGPKGGNWRHCMQLVNPGDEGSKASETETSQPCKEHGTSL